MRSIGPHRERGDPLSCNSGSRGIAGAGTKCTAMRISHVEVSVFHMRCCVLALLVGARALVAQTPDSVRADTTRRTEVDSLARRRAVSLAPVRVTAFGAPMSPARVPYSIAVRQPT